MHRPAKDKKRNVRRKPPHVGSRWQLQDAKARLSQLVRDAQKTPQIITLHGQEIAVVQSIADHRKQTDAATRDRPSLLEELLKCPPGPPLKIHRDPKDTVGAGSRKIFD